MNLIFLLNFSCQQNVIKIIWNCVRCDKKNTKRYGTPLYCDIHSFDINNKLIWYFFLHNVMSNRVKHNKSNHKLSTRNMLVFVVVGFVLRCNNFSNAFSGWILVHLIFLKTFKRWLHFWYLNIPYTTWNKSANVVKERFVYYGVYKCSYSKTLFQSGPRFSLSLKMTNRSIQIYNY